MKNAIEKVRGNLSGHRMTIKDVVADVLKKSDPEFGDDEDLNILVTLLKKQSSQRSQLDIDKIRLSFFRFKFFQELEQQMGAEMVSGLYKQLSYEVQHRRQTVFNIGDLGKKFYIILKGSVWVLVQKKGLQDGSGPTEEDQKQEQDLKDEKNKEMMENAKKNKKMKNKKNKPQAFITQVTLNDIFATMTDKEFLDTQFPTLQKVGQINSGESFGEIALTKQVPRQATIVAAEDTHFATVTRDQFNRLLSAFYEAQQKVNIGFLSKVAIFSDWNDQMLNQLYYHFKQEERKLFQIIYKENEEANNIYLLKSGEVELCKFVNLTQSVQNNSIINKFFTRNEQKLEKVRTSIITPGQIFGHEEVLAGIKREYRAISISQKVQYFVLDKQRFLQYFQKGAAIQKLQHFDQNKITQRKQSLDIIKQIKKIPQSIEFREVPFIEQSQNQQILKNSFERIGNPVEPTGYEMLQGHGHINKAHYNFRRNINVIYSNLKDTEPLSLEKAFFQIEASKGSSISIINRIFPAAARPKYVIPDSSISSKTIIKCLKLPKILTEVDKVMLNHKNQEYLDSFKAQSIRGESLKTII
ncbi:unnamed protein product (macronuclear) [Paramecium tetraurelia]|uniref:Cyclic nucleotide-binding domain-containing protein n=1 Tax=Paramecium tetraurelia TaxID=5888 RepID=A0D0X2_PARTE|nr:uncharacterized protein GSPATT00012241001 [Paramecium tetraurelia]CAK76689.1 unnamed protein product [Paramecium tetraurelia]|eukprot:XP_001444086.1 hypothetical protein (macronuclear) [Paramecium tetraurelia strain d4-2]